MSGVTAGLKTMADAQAILTHTLVWTAGTSPGPARHGIACDVDGRGAVKVDSYLEVLAWPGVFALGDCASIPDLRTGKTYPPMAQHAIRETSVAAKNVAAGMAASAALSSMAAARETTMAAHRMHQSQTRRVPVA